MFCFLGVGIEVFYLFCSLVGVLWLFWCRYGWFRECVERLLDRGLVVGL